MGNNIFDILKQMFGHSAYENGESTIRNTRTGLFHRKPSAEELNSLMTWPSELRLHIDNDILIVTHDYNVGGLYNFLASPSCGNYPSPTWYLDNMRWIIEEDFDKAQDSLVIPLKDDNCFLINIADRVEPRSFYEELYDYKLFIEQKLDVFYPLIVGFIKKRASSHIITIEQNDRGWTSIGLRYLATRLTKDGFKCEFCTPHVSY